MAVDALVTPEKEAEFIKAVSKPSSLILLLHLPLDCLGSGDLRSVASISTLVLTNSGMLYESCPAK